MQAFSFFDIPKRNTWCEDYVTVWCFVIHVHHGIAVVHKCIYFMVCCTTDYVYVRVCVCVCACSLKLEIVIEAVFSACKAALWHMHYRDEK